MSELPADKHYPKTWHSTKEQMDAYDDLMRKKMNYQKTDYAQNGELLCFGLSEHSLTEHLPKFSEKALKDIKVIKGRLSKEDLLPRPAFNSAWSQNIDLWRAQLRLGLGALIIRELPIRSFVSRCVIMYAYVVYFLGRGLSKGLRDVKPSQHYLQPYAIKNLVNRPDLFKMALTRVVPKVPFAGNAHNEWKLKQTPVYHQYHRTTYRYRMRKPRYVGWDGTMHQPVMPFFIDDSTGVINGTFRRNPNTNPNLK